MPHITRVKLLYPIPALLNDIVRTFGASKFALACVCLLVLGGCNGRASKGEVIGENANTAANVIPSTRAGEQHELTFHGFNYTNRYIDKYSVNGHGAGHLRVSGRHGGGGSSVCCFVYSQEMTPAVVTVKWQHGGCKYDVEANPGEKAFQFTHSYFKTSTIAIDQPVPENPNFINVHFYQDGTVKVNLSSKPVKPRLDLAEAREDKSSYTRCPDGKKPSQ